MKNLNPDLDGIDHINISFIARTKLGKMLNDFSNVPTWDEDGNKYRSAYGFLCYLKTGKSDTRFSSLTAKEAHSLFILLRRGANKKDIWVPNLLGLYWKALRTRIEKNPSLKELFYQNDLPIVSYILDDQDKPVIRTIDNGVVSRYNKLIR